MFECHEMAVEQRENPASLQAKSLHDTHGQVNT